MVTNGKVLLLLLLPSQYPFDEFMGETSFLRSYYPLVQCPAQVSSRQATLALHSSNVQPSNLINPINHSNIHRATTRNIVSMKRCLFPKQSIRTYSQTCCSSPPPSPCSCLPHSSFPLDTNDPHT